MENIFKEFKTQINQLTKERTIPSGAYMLKEFKIGYGTDETFTDETYKKADSIIKKYIENPIKYNSYGVLVPVKAFVKVSYHLGGGSYKINVLTSNGIEIRHLSDYEFECLKNKLEYITKL